MNMKHTQDLLDLYHKNPCRTLPNAFWKTAARLDKSHLTLQKDLSGEITAIALWEESRLMAFWCAEPQHHPLTPEQIAETPFILVHADALAVFGKREFNHTEPYFRIIHRGAPQVFTPPHGFALKNVNPHTEVEDIVRLIHTCYRNIRITSQIVRDWLEHPVYDPNLWVWIMDDETGAHAGLGIAEMDHQVSEASLEWVQVLPKYQKRGLGTTIVSELLHRISGNVDFITVSGKQNHATKPEQLYRRCGFTGSDVWYLLRART